jgi:ubiquinone/menaquinone biosynthesis C-methylase UbiE
MPEHYTLGYAAPAVAFVARRRLDPDGAELIPFLRPGLAVLDCGCGPGTITADIAERVEGGEVVGLDLDASQVGLGRERARQRGLTNLRFEQGDAYRLPFADGRFDAVFTHALLEHLREPARAMREFRRVLRPGGVAVMRAPDWSGFLYSPRTPGLVHAVRSYCEIQNRNGGDVEVGHKLREYALQAGFERVRASACYENYQPLSVIGDLVAWALDSAGLPEPARAMRDWATLADGMFAEAWVSCIGFRPAS